MTSNSDFDNWQKAIQGIEVGQKDLSPDELSAFNALKVLVNSSNFESNQSGGNIKVIKNALSSHNKHRLLKAHLTNFIALCEKNFTNKNVSFAQTQISTFEQQQEPVLDQSQATTAAQLQEPTFVPPQIPTFSPPSEMPMQQLVPSSPTTEELPNEYDKVEYNEIVQDIEAERIDLPQEELIMPEQLTQAEISSPTFGNILIDDIAKWQKAIQGIEAEQKNMSSEEWVAFEELSKNCRIGNFEFVGNSALIKELKNALPNHSKHRLLQKVHLPNFINLCEKYFKEVAKENITAFIVSQNIIAQSDEPTVETLIIQEDGLQPEIKFSEEDQNDPIINSQNADAQNDISDSQPPAFQPPTFQPPTFQPPSFKSPVDQEETERQETKITEPKQKKNPEKPQNKISNLIIVAIIVAIIGIWLVYQNWDTVGEKLGLISDKTDITVIDDQTEVSADEPEMTDEDNKEQFQQPDASASISSGNVDSNNSENAKTQQTNTLANQSTSSGNEVPKNNEKPSGTSVSQSVSSGTVSVTGGSYSGELKRGQPHGMGTIRYNSRTLIDSRDTKKRYAEAGQSFTGQFRDGRLLQGKLFDSNGNQIETIIIGGGAY